jgi:hypothetical protein
MVAHCSQLQLQIHIKDPKKIWRAHYPVEFLLIKGQGVANHFALLFFFPGYVRGISQEQTKNNVLVVLFMSGNALLVVFISGMSHSLGITSHVMTKDLAQGHSFFRNDQYLQ